jgi:hypothetical protein
LQRRTRYFQPDQQVLGTDWNFFRRDPLLCRQRIQHDFTGETLT